MKIISHEESGRCPVCMDVDSLQHLAFNCLHSATNHRRQEWFADTEALRKLLAQAVHLFTRLAFAALLDLNGIRHKTAVQLTLQLARMTASVTQHIPRIAHADKVHMS